MKSSCELHRHTINMLSHIIKHFRFWDGSWKLNNPCLEVFIYAAVAIQNAYRIRSNCWIFLMRSMNAVRGGVSTHRVNPYFVHTIGKSISDNAFYPFLCEWVLYKN